jgi:predicted 3-demethylubiquinone-9 3-methyltransferase (glyoxalase superfamily)
MAKNDAHPQKFKHSEGKSVAFDAERLTRIDSVFQDLVRRGEIPHAVTFVAHRGNIVHFKAFGWRDKEKKFLAKETIFFAWLLKPKPLRLQVC